MTEFRYAGRVATKVFPSPVFISAIFPSASEIPPSSCESKCLKPIVLFEASLTAANAKGSMAYISLLLFS